jgi:hypothetical protein
MNYQQENRNTDRKPKASKMSSRMKMCWKIIRARRKSAASRASSLGSLYATDRNQMLLYIK